MRGLASAFGPPASERGFGGFRRGASPDGCTGVIMSGLPDARECRARAIALLKRAASATDAKEKQELELAAREYEKVADEIEKFQPLER